MIMNTEVYFLESGLRRETALRAIGATILQDEVNLWEAADRLHERWAAEFAYCQFRRCLAVGLADEPMGEQAMFCFFLAAAVERGDL
jgi:hypothetical protein